MSDSLTQPLNKSIKESVDPSKTLDPSRTSVNHEEVLTESMTSVDQDISGKLLKRYKVIWVTGAVCLVFGFILFLILPLIIHSLVVKGAIQQAVLSKDNENFWAHFPGESNTVITRNYSFFNLMNEEGMLLHGQKPKFKEIQGFIIQELQDYLNITYSKDGNYVTMKDWLHFDYYKDSKDLNQKVKPINAPSMGYWYTLKNSRDALVFIEGFALLFSNIEDSIVDTVIGQGISAQYLTDYSTTYVQLLQPAGISAQNAHFLWSDDAYGFKDKNNLKYWVSAAKTSFIKSEPAFSTDALNLKDYFTLSDSQLTFIIREVKQYISSLEELIFQNHYCMNITDVPCDGRELAVRQIAQSYVTYNTPPVSSITPKDTICFDNTTCYGFWPELSSFYNRVYLKRHPEADPFLKFDNDMVRKWLDYNPGRIKGEYNKARSALLHIGNLDVLFDHGDCYDDTELDETTRNSCLKVIKDRFEVTSINHTKVFWEWIKYILNELLRQKTIGNQILGIGTTFTKGIYESFAFLQDNLQETLLRTMIKNKLSSKVCTTFISESLQTQIDSSAVLAICEKYGEDVHSDAFVSEAIRLCRNKFRSEWALFKKLGATNIQLESFCDEENLLGFGAVYNNMRIEINDFYNCDQTPNHYCSDYELALIQWASGNVTLRQPTSAGNSLQSSTTFATWNSKAPAFEYYHYTQKFPNETFQTFNMSYCYQIFNFDRIFSAPFVIYTFLSHETPKHMKNYMRFVSIFMGLRGFTHERSAKELIFGYNDEYLLERKNNYPPFGGDPSTPAYTAFNDLNLTEDQATLELEWHTGKADSLMTGQYRKINGLTYLTTNYTRFNGNETYWVLESPWAEKDYFYGTSGKQFSPNQPVNKNVSIYVPNIQRYGSGSLNESYPYERYGYDLQIAYLGRYIYETGDEWPDNKKYWQNFFGVFNETSVIGFPLFMTKHHFMNVSKEWSNKVEIYEENGNRITEANHWDDSYVIVEPYSGVSFQSVIYLQAIYYFEPDALFTYNETVMLPVFAIFRSGNLTQHKADELFKPLVTALSVKTTLFYIGIVFALVGAVGFGYGLTKKKQLQRHLKKQKKLQKKSTLSLQDHNRAIQQSSTATEPDEISEQAPKPRLMVKETSEGELKMKEESPEEIGL